MTVYHAHGYKLTAFMKDGEPWVKSVPTECPSEECTGCKSRQIVEDLRSNDGFHS